MENSGLPVLEVTDAQQRGPDFGTRLANAVADAFAQGYEQVIVVGSDCPRLHEVDWSSVTQRLTAGTPVLGPTPDEEGAYLIGLRRDHFNRSSFEGLPWQAPALLDALARHLSRQAGTAPARLVARADVNGHRDLLSLLRASRGLPVSLAAQLRVVLAGEERANHVDEATTARRVSIRRSRAPPLSGFVSSGDGLIVE